MPPTLFLLLKLDDDDELVLEVDPLYDGLTKVSSLDLDLLGPDTLDKARLGKPSDRGLLEADLLDGLLELDLGLGDESFTETLDTDLLSDPAPTSREPETPLEELFGGVLHIGGVLGGVLPLDKPPGDLLDDDLDPEL